MQTTLHTHKRRPTIAKEWQLAVLKCLRSESENPTEEKILAAVAQTGLDEKWIRNWFTRQRSKAAARHTKGKGATAEPRRQRAQIPTFKVDLHTLPALPNGPRDLPSASTPIEPTPWPSAKSLRQPSPVNVESQSSAIPRSYQTISASTYFNDPSTSSITPSSRTTAISTYSRDPLYNRYPDFSQFFLSQPQSRPPIFELPIPIDDHNPLMPLLAVPNTDPYIPMQLFNSSTPLHLPAQPSSPANLGPCPIAFSMRLVDLLSRL
ncbi:hypothetical protein JVU11DRAFT_3390 [Chiua virens]|nr:hypothetical protein JVU11DRAFT_3390 [Chiua virens]